MPTKKEKVIRKLIPGVNDLKTVNPALALEVDGWDPTTMVAGSGKKMPWVCSYGHKWTAPVGDRHRRGDKCPICSNRIILVGFNDFSTTHPELAKEAFEWDTSTVTQGSEKKIKWRCPLGHIYITSVYKRAVRNQGCPYCSNQKLLVGFNDLMTTNKKLALEANGWDPSTVVAGSPKRKKWVCEKGHSWEAGIRDRHRNHLGCPICANYKILIGFNDLQTTHPEIAREAFKWNPTTVVAGSERKKDWKCSLGHKYSANIRDRTRVDSGCPFCSNHKLLKGFNDLKTTHPEIAKEANKWDPTSIVAGTQKKYEWKCSEGHTWKSAPSSRTGRGDGCPSCAKYGFDPNKDGYIYFLKHESWEMLQIGITNYPTKRTSLHEKLGWEIEELRGPMDGHLTQDWETAILRMLKAKGVDLSNSKIAGKFDGYSEAWSKSTFEAKSIKELMQLTEEFEEGNKTH